VFALCPQHDDADTGVGIQGLKGGPELISLAHADDVEGRPAQHDIRTLLTFLNIDAEPIKTAEGVCQGMLKGSHRSVDPFVF
jgi:hypothetical protein